MSRGAVAIGVGVALAILSWPAQASRMALSVEYNALKSELIVEVKETDRERGMVSVEKVFFGPAKAGDVLLVAGLKEVPHKLLDRVPGSGRTRERSAEGAKAVLFLVRGKDGRDWQLFDGVFGVRWIVGEAVYVWSPIVMTPGPYAFLSAGRGKDVDALYEAIQKGLEDRKRFEAALNQADVKQRIHGLLAFVRSNEISEFREEALRELVSLGPVVGETLREEAAQHGQTRSRHKEILYALGELRDHSSVPYLLEVEARTKAPFAKAGRTLKELKTSPADYEAYQDWTAALEALYRIADARALGAFRDALLWAVRSSDVRVVFVASRGLAECATRENLATLKAALDLCPYRDETGFCSDARWHIVRDIGYHRFPEAVPLLVSQLDYPWGASAQEARDGLRRIVGKDLGPQKEPWLKWYEEHRTPEGGKGTSHEAP